MSINLIFSGFIHIKTGVQSISHMLRKHSSGLIDHKVELYPDWSKDISNDKYTTLSIRSFILKMTVILSLKDCIIAYILA